MVSGLRPARRSSVRSRRRPGSLERGAELWVAVDAAEEPRGVKGRQGRVPGVGDSKARRGEASHPLLVTRLAGAASGRGSHTPGLRSPAVSGSPGC
ncbi:hypothetical protein NN561_000045 [Cricetulus griseus]